MLRNLNKSEENRGKHSPFRLGGSALRRGQPFGGCSGGGVSADPHGRPPRAGGGTGGGWQMGRLHGFLAGQYGKT